jgi:hypothetical protein
LEDEEEIEKSKLKIKATMQNLEIHAGLQRSDLKLQERFDLLSNFLHS